jgi:hypothetical protein
MKKVTAKGKTRYEHGDYQSASNRIDGDEIWTAPSGDKPTSYYVQRAAETRRAELKGISVEELQRRERKKIS